MTRPELFFRTLLVQGPSDTVAQFAKAFGINHEYIMELEVDDNYDYLDHHAKALSHQRVKGDFTYFIQPFLWDFKEDDFQAILMELSARDLAIALPDDESESPFQHLLFFDGKKQIIDIGEDDVFDENYVVNDVALRQRLSQITAGTS